MRRFDVVGVVLVMIGVFIFAPIVDSVYAADSPSYETDDVRVSVRSANLSHRNQKLDVALVVENILDSEIQASIDGNIVSTYAFDDLGTSWSLGNWPKGIATGNDACQSGTTMQPGEVRPVLLHFTGMPKARPNSLTLGPAIYVCVDGTGEKVPVSLDGVSLTDGGQR